MAANRFSSRVFRTGAATFACGACGKITRDTGHDEEALQLCRRCLLTAYADNATSDYGADSPEAADARKALSDYNRSHK